MSPEDKYKLPSDLLFFNYHEFLTNDYKPADHTIDPRQQAVVVNHFPNVYVGIESPEFKTTRIVRIPRVFDTIEYPDLIPQFSTYWPGSEPSAIVKQGEAQFTVAGYWQAHAFGASSLTPLTGVVDPAELAQIVHTINSYIYTAYDPAGFWNAVDAVLDIFTGSLYSLVVNKHLHSKKAIRDLEHYIDEVNAKHRDKFEIIYPRRTGFLSLDIQVKAP